MCSAYRSETNSDPVENRSHSHRRKRGAGLVSESVLTATTNMSEYGTFYHPLFLIWNARTPWMICFFIVLMC